MLEKLLISSLYVEICVIQVSVSYFDQILGKRESQTRQVFNFAILWFWNFLWVQNIVKMVKSCENRENRVIPLR